jgi:archaellum component FlaC
LREDPKYQEKESQMARRRYKQRQEQLQGLCEQLRYQQDLINFSQQKIESMTFQIYELESTLNLTSLEAATTKTTNLEKLKMELEQTKAQMNRNCWDTIIERNLCSSNS